MLAKKKLQARDFFSLLLLEDGYFFVGSSFGFLNQIDIGEQKILAADIKRLCGELCFNTSMSGYQEILSDPSYAGQMLCFSFPHIGNVGCNEDDYECGKPQVLGMISREAPTEPSNWRSSSSLSSWLERHRVSGIGGVDTRALIHHLRQHGSQRALLGALPAKLWPSTAGSLQAKIIEPLMQLLRDSPNMAGQNLAFRVSRPKAELYSRDVARWLPWETHASYGNKSNKRPPKLAEESPANLHVVVLDFGTKENILQTLKRFVAKVTVLPLNSSWPDLAALRPDGLLLSNGPGDPAPVYLQIAEFLQHALALRLPIFGICLGHQILALSLGARTAHMHHGHRGSNHPVLNVGRNTVEITSQNHGFSVAEDSLPPDLKVTHRSLFDYSIEGISSGEYPAFSVQYHPESSPGPHDSVYLFRDFIALMQRGTNVF